MQGCSFVWKWSYCYSSNEQPWTKCYTIDGKGKKTNKLFSYCSQGDFISTLQLLSIYNKCHASPDDSAQKPQWLQWIFCQMTVSHLSNCSDIYIQQESRQSWLICIGLNHCCRLWGLPRSDTERATYCVKMKWLMSNQVTHSIKWMALRRPHDQWLHIGWWLLKLNTQYASYPNWDVIIKGFSNWKGYCNISCTAVVLFIMKEHVYLL